MFLKSLKDEIKIKNILFNGAVVFKII